MPYVLNRSRDVPPPDFHKTNLQHRLTSCSRDVYSVAHKPIKRTTPFTLFYYIYALSLVVSVDAHDGAS